MPGCAEVRSAGTHSRRPTSAGPSLSSGRRRGRRGRRSHVGAPLCGGIGPGDRHLFAVLGAPIDILLESPVDKEEAHLFRNRGRLDRLANENFDERLLLLSRYCRPPWRKSSKRGVRALEVELLGVVA